MKIFFIASIFVLAFCAFAFGQNSNCPKVSVIGPSSVSQIGETATFTVSVVGEIQYSDNPQYVWSVSSGKIVEGQGTPTITVEITSGSTVTATVDVKGLPEGCENTDSESALTGCSRPSPMMFDEFEISSRINSAKLDALISYLENNPTDTAYFIIYHYEKDSSEKIKNREDYIRNYLLENRIGPDRMVFVRINGGEFDLDNSVIRIWRVPQGATPPTP